MDGPSPKVLREWLLSEIGIEMSTASCFLSVPNGTQYADGGYHLAIAEIFHAALSKLEKGIEGEALAVEMESLRDKWEEIRRDPKSSPVSDFYLSGERQGFRWVTNVIRTGNRGG